jgi:hypothetical protein
VRHEDAAAAISFHFGAKQGEHLRSVLCVEIAGGLIGEYQLRSMHQRAGDRCPLQFPARELARITCRVRGQPTASNISNGTIPRLTRRDQNNGGGTVCATVRCGRQTPETQPDTVAAHERALSIVQGKFDGVKLMLPRSGVSSPAIS